MTTFNQVVATTSSYLFSKAAAIIHVLSGDLHCTTGHLELALSMFALLIVSLYVLTGILGMINMVLGNVVHEDPICPPGARWPEASADKKKVVTINETLIPSTDEAWDNQDLGADEAFVGTVKASELEVDASRFQ